MAVMVREFQHLDQGAMEGKPVVIPIDHKVLQEKFENTGA